ncbi:immunity protein Imm1 of predicted polymorphic toxin system [Kribbella voronezhensis]|uniref:Immunity protein Imm1 of predicted polymorphic toxin system n=1 Tax=Kribbella voronezhensis TaxID=2512212 RepID=A0A4R7T575_9ACTN|nr:Imm1 family immunity protein [Kribbella voronezhensis]TDU87004.1 immunity protein Imm1 of predicted polymorphic toxin system [Kribbella voronezhensis]
MTHTAKAYFKRWHSGEPVSLTTADEVDQMLDALAAESWENSVAALYIDGRLDRAGRPDHELQVAVDYADKTMGVLRYSGNDGTYFSKGSTSSDGDSVLYYYLGNEREFPRNSVVPMEVARAAVKEFLQSGGERPTAVDWQE